MNWDALYENAMLFGRGTFLTVSLLCCSVALSFLLSIPMAMALNSHRLWLRIPAACYTAVIRGIPALIQLFMVYYGLSQFAAMRESFLWPWFSNATFCTLFVFVFNTVAYTGEIFAGAARDIPRGEIEAGRSIGMSDLRLTLRIIIPTMLRRALPQYSNEIILLLHATALASTVTLLDITGVAQLISMRTYLMLEPYLAAAALYMVITLFLTRLLRMAERRWLAHLVS